MVGMGVFCCFSFDSGGIAQKFMLLVKKMRFSVLCSLFLLGKLETHRFCQKNYQSTSVRIPPVSAGSSNSRSAHPPFPEGWAPGQPSSLHDALPL